MNWGAPHEVAPRRWRRYCAPVKFGDRLRELREERDLSLSDVSRLSGITRSAWSEFETGGRSNPTLATLRAMACALDIELEHLLANVDRRSQGGEQD